MLDAGSFGQQNNQTYAEYTWHILALSGTRTMSLKQVSHFFQTKKYTSVISIDPGIFSNCRFCKWSMNCWRGKFRKLPTTIYQQRNQKESIERCETAAWIEEKNQYNHTSISLFYSDTSWLICMKGAKFHLPKRVLITSEDTWKSQPRLSDFWVTYSSHIRGGPGQTWKEHNGGIRVMSLFWVFPSPKNLGLGHKHNPHLSMMFSSNPFETLPWVQTSSFFEMIRHSRFRADMTKLNKLIDEPLRQHLKQHTYHRILCLIFHIFHCLFSIHV